ncbi:imidazole glycerol phosphate synthase subunit HisF [Ferroacidibacillus organovorans]|uniref:Imidazole glycerol phosphate synthase subunit HisF n=1 Tax=Ferroacidibacillus organovorans TaxID=1765683 RepID=A0A162SV19_9BACL|nr:imidazole glycerol phosphate synthase subunit HisF [Ferroacidibacillus organovorans]KYP80177.1 imidazole glycerol phosphate synthase subunit HisF [Ferroacidibacillus organovorans]OAG95054.1 imidazole glycerol phosphate synthase cyclase subunit [Ferroacidibacillus organovorans]OPG17626.1 imidazole glycerol phosphate synthase subunit HisF [Ferroacidibacillus organovorans]
MITKRIIPCFDVRNGRVVKFQSFFANERDAGDPVILAKRYDEQGADELVMLDISATHEGRRTMLDIVSETAAQVFIPFTVGGGIGSVAEVRDVLRAGADKVSLNSAAVKNPALISESAKRFGSQCVVIALDAKRRTEQSWDVLVSGGRINTGKSAVAWAKEAEARGAGELLVTSFDEDGQRDGYDLALTRAIADAVSIPVIASGGAGCAEHFYDVFTAGGADAALAASIFHFAETSVTEVKKNLRERGVSIR